MSYDLIVVGTGFASSFFLHGWLAKAKKDAKVLVLERGPRRGAKWASTERSMLWKAGKGTFDCDHKKKPWLYAPAMGGTSLVWTGTTPRMLPEDFELKSRYGVGVDWPLSYGDLEEHYGAAEEIMGVAGASDASPFERSRPYPLPPHKLSLPGTKLREARPDSFFPLANARASQDIPGPNGRSKCCTNYLCTYCPVDAKFSVLNGLAGIYKDPRVELRVGARVTAVEHSGGMATGVRWRSKKKDESAKGALVALGANALFNPFLLAQSGLDSPVLGKYLHEQMLAAAFVNLKGMNGSQGSTSSTGADYGFARGELRKRRGAMVMEVTNQPWFRFEEGRWLERFRVVGFIEDLPQAENRVELGGKRPKTVWTKRSAYADKAHKAFKKDVEKICEALPVESIEMHKVGKTAGHIQGTARMGADAADSVVDRHLVHHKVRNLLVLGGSAFPTTPPARPTLTIAALSLWAASKLG